MYFELSIGEIIISSYYGFLEIYLVLFVRNIFLDSLCWFLCIYYIGYLSQF